MDTAPSSSSLYQQAINAALNSKWDEALKINKKILKLDPQNVDALNRQAKAYLELGKSNLARKYYAEVLKFDPYNPIALKNLKIIKSAKFDGQNLIAYSQNRLSPFLFLQEPGKTKIVNLLKIAEPQKLSHVFCGMKVATVIKNRGITIVDALGNYLGVLPDDISHHLLRLLRGGNKYELFVKSVRVNSLAIIIKETFRSKRFKNQPSFLDLSPSTAVSTSVFAAISGADDEAEELEEDPEA